MWPIVESKSIIQELGITQALSCSVLLQWKAKEAQIGFSILWSTRFHFSKQFDLSSFTWENILTALIETNTDVLSNSACFKYLWHTLPCVFVGLLLELWITTIEKLDKKTWCSFEACAKNLVLSPIEERYWHILQRIQWVYLHIGKGNLIELSWACLVLRYEICLNELCEVRPFYTYSSRSNRLTISFSKTIFET